ncbi:unnamed protein product, partial [Didymodactylos carnosus]
GTQLENEKLCKKIKLIEQQQKQSEKSMFEENERLRQELIQTKNQLEQEDKYQRFNLNNNATITHHDNKLNGAIVLTDLNSNSSDNIYLLKQENERLNTKINSYEFREQTHSDDIMKLKKQLSWYTDTQMSNDQLKQQSLKQKIDEINDLKQKYHQLEVKYQQQEQQKSDDRTLRSLDQRRIQDLERQLKELEFITRKQQPSSQIAMTLNTTYDKHQMENKLRKVEEQLVEKRLYEEKLLKDLHISEQKYNYMKAIKMYEERLEHLESGIQSNSIQPIRRFEERLNDLLTKNENIVSSNEHTTLRQENEQLKFELEKEREKNTTGLQIQQQQQTQPLSARTTTLKPSHSSEQQSNINKTVPLKSTKRDLETIKLLRSDLERKNEELDKLRALYDAVCVQHKSLIAERDREKTRQAVLGNKPYSASRFIEAITPVELIQSENEDLKHLVKKLEHETAHRETELQRLRDEREFAIQTAIRSKDEEISQLRQQHKVELQRALTEISVNATDVRISELLRKVETQDVIIRQLKKQCEQAADNAKELAILRVSDDELRSTITKLENKLDDARLHQTPKMKHFQQLETKIQQLDSRLEKRERIQKDYKSSILKQQEDSNDDVYKLRSIIQQKNQEIERFHVELDTMLQLLKQLKGQDHNSFI